MVIFGICFIFFATTLGSAAVYLFKREIPPKASALFFGLASGIMLASSVWSLLVPAIEQSRERLGAFAFLPAAVGLVLGGLLLTLLERVAGVDSEKLFLAVTLHNIPEGLAVGFAFGAARSSQSLVAALALAVGVGLQNVPEGAAVSLPLKTSLGNKRAFIRGMVSGAVEPVFAVIGYFLSAWLIGIQPWLLALSAGAMIFVVAEELLPEVGENARKYSAWGTLLGFALMMTLDVVLG